MTLLDTALSAGLNADYVLFDSWFSNPAQITAIHSKDMDVIAMIKKSSRIKYSYSGEQLNIKEIYCRNKKSVVADQNICFLLTLWLEKIIQFQQRSSA